MHFFNLIKKISEEKDIMLFVDMDGVIVNYDVGKPSDFLEKRPLKENIEKIREIVKIPNVELHILSICKKDCQIEEKEQWLDKFAPFFDKKNRQIISKEKLGDTSSKEVKTNYLKNLGTKKQVILLDDDNAILKFVLENVEDIIVFQDSELID